ncbi:putative HET-domain-containing protein [Seiridium cardinale]|uniref:HET-domain-containing protein n=1 Tax=Seiridium cardinale TaxID=138064 RepID=A0ABR2Y063_9PEZI
MEDLPKTFQDAVKISHRIGKRFLWVDSLAIIQDDNQDWQSESAQMAAIYENAYLTIAATTSEYCRGGCDLEPWDLRIIEGKTETGPGKYRPLFPDPWLPAIAGMIRFPSAKIDDTPLHGLWKKTIALDLGWRCQQEQTSKASGVPTWTWLSSEGEIKGPVNLTPESNILQISIDSSYIEWKARPASHPLNKVPRS